MKWFIVVFFILIVGCASPSERQYIEGEIKSVDTMVLEYSYSDQPGKAGLQESTTIVFADGRQIGFMGVPSEELISGKCYQILYHGDKFEEAIQLYPSTELGNVDRLVYVDYQEDTKGVLRSDPKNKNVLLVHCPNCEKVVGSISRKRSRFWWFCNREKTSCPQAIPEHHRPLGDGCQAARCKVCDEEICVQGGVH